MKVYVVTSGEYSDFGIEQIFSTKEKAEEFIRIQTEYADRYFNEEINEYELDPEIKVPYSGHKFKYFYYISMDKEGNVIDRRKSGHLNILEPEKSEESLYLHNYMSDKGILLTGEINANSMEHAIKIMGEIRTRLLAQNKWPDKIEERAWSLDLRIKDYFLYNNDGVKLK